MCIEDLFEKYFFLIIVFLLILILIHKKTNIFNTYIFNLYYNKLINHDYVYIYYIILSLVIIYLPKLPNKYNYIFDNVIFDLSMLAFIIFFSDKNITISLLLSILYINERTKFNDKTNYLINDSNKNIDDTNTNLCKLNKRLLKLETNNNYYDVNINKYLSDNELLFNLKNNEKINLKNDYKTKLKNNEFSISNMLNKPNDHNMNKKDFLLIEHKKI
jgi:hypothetical protein